MRNIEDSKFYEMYVEIRKFILELRERYGGGPKAAADSLMGLCLMVARVTLDEKLSTDVAFGYIKTFMGFLASMDDKDGAKLGEILGKGSN
jgi:hypothetical protein